MHNKKWLWLFLGLWLTALQSVAVMHTSEQPLTHDHTHCLLCNFGSQQVTGPMAAPTPAVTATLISVVAEAQYSQPAIPQIRRAVARAPPVLS
ncbi:hypothetical protein [Shewanella mangrovi]|uniref:hypothetical protein n=1 Tax=Shewanella mangrovi TaxID=1515746 RepID=UPI0012E000D6|nr:hypothetical protein [Shewanella mangrovi]